MKEGIRFFLNRIFGRPPNSLSLGSISPTCLLIAFTRKNSTSAKRQSIQQCSLVLLGSGLTKAARKMLVKLTQSLSNSLCLYLFASFSILFCMEPTHVSIHIILTIKAFFQSLSVQFLDSSQRSITSFKNKIESRTSRSV